MKLERKDYCGPYWVPSLLRRLVSNKFNASCKIHDMDYESQKYSRYESDVRFKQHSLRQAKSSKFWRAVAILFYIMVRIGGRISYGKSDTK